jgi:hypothetical protein
VEWAILPRKMARPSLRDRVLGRTLAAFQARVPAKITLVNDDGVLAETALDQHSGDAARWIATLRHFLADRWQTTIRAGVEDALCPGGAEGI